MLTMRQKKAVTRELRDRYQRSSKKEKTHILNGFIQLTGYNRSYAARTLRIKEVLGYMNIGGRRVRLVRDKRKIKRKKKKIYDQDVLVALKGIWKIGDYICSKRLAPFLSEIIPVLEKWGEIKLDAKVRKKLFKISASSIDRLLADIRKRYQLKGRSTTKPGTLLKKSIPIKTFTDWDEAKPPYRRVLASPDIEDKIKVKLRKEYAMLNPAELKRKITKLQNKLLKLNALKQAVRENLDKSTKSLSSFEYIST